MEDMAFSYLRNMELEEAKAAYARFLEDRNVKPKTETVATDCALDRITSEAI